MTAVPILEGVNPAIPATELPAVPERLPSKDMTLFSLKNGNINPLAAHCNIPLALLAYICHEKPVTGLNTIVADISQALVQLENELAPLDEHDPITKKSAHYCLCAMADTVLATNGLEGGRGKQGHFLQTHYGVNYEERRIYDMTLRLLRQPQKNREVLELIYLCFNLGFDQFRDSRDMRFAAKREDVLGKIRNAFLDNWREGVGLHALATKEVVHKAYQVKANLPVWPIYLLTPLALACVYWLFNRDLNERLAAVTDLLKGFH